MPHLEAVKRILDTTLGLNGRALEDHFGIVVADDDIHARHFATVGTLHDFVFAQLRP